MGPLLPFSSCGGGLGWLVKLVSGGLVRFGEGVGCLHPQGPSRRVPTQPPEGPHHTPPAPAFGPPPFGLSRLDPKHSRPPHIRAFPPVAPPSLLVRRTAVSGCRASGRSCRRARYHARCPLRKDKTYPLARLLRVRSARRQRMQQYPS